MAKSKYQMYYYLLEQEDEVRKFLKEQEFMSDSDVDQVFGALETEKAGGKINTTGERLWRDNNMKAGLSAQFPRTKDEIENDLAQNAGSMSEKSILEAAFKIMGDDTSKVPTSLAKIIEDNLIVGASEAQLMELVDNFTISGTKVPEALIELLGINSIERTLNGVPRSFSPIVIPNAEIKEKTKISEHNARISGLLRDEDVSDIMATLEGSGGQEEFAYGYFDDDGQINVFDGQRRRLSLILDGRYDFKIYVADNGYQLTFLDYLSFDKRSETKKARSLIENGVYWEKVRAAIEEEERREVSDRALADIVGESRETVRKALRAAVILELDIIQLVYSVRELGATLAMKFIDLEPKIKGGEQNYLSELLLAKEKYLVQLGDTIKDLSEATVNKKVFDHVSAQLNILIGENGSPKEAAPKMKPFAKTPKGTSVASSSKVVGDKTQYSLKLKLPTDVSNDLAKEIEALVKQHLEKSSLAS
ncbi:Chromosome (plasmid) partitioning protein ParB [Vibrio chagasii]|nr:Chromosome (plasmid) partitioning protein ParB [Vibrio chagasii]